MSSVRVIQHSWPGLLTGIGPKTPRLIWADPPYNLGIEYDGDETGDRLPTDEYHDWCVETMSTLFDMLEPGGMLWWLTWAHHGQQTWTSAAILGDLLHGAPIIFHERFANYQMRRLTLDYRLLFPIVKPGADPVFNNGPGECRVPSARQEEYNDPRANPDGRVPGHVWTVRRLQGTSKDRVDWHNAQIAPEPLELIVKGWTNPGDTVLDAFAGSGNMGVACKKLGRDFIGVDQSREYCRKIRERVTGEASFVCCGCRSALSNRRHYTYSTAMGSYCDICYDAYSE